MMAYIMLMDHHMLPTEYNALPPQVKGFLIAAYEKQKHDTDKARQE